MRRAVFPTFCVLAIILIAGNIATAQYYRIPSDRPSRIPYPETIADINKLTPEDSYSLPWGLVMEENLAWKKRVWRTIDANEAGNEVFENNAEVQREHSLVNILISGFFNGKIKAYGTDDDRFTSELSKDDFIKLLASGPNNTPGFNPDKITKFRIKEDWLFLDTQQVLVVRIVGIAPLIQVNMPDGTVTDKPMVWFYYAEVRNELAAHKVFDGKNNADMNWDQLFEGRKFKGTIDKISPNYPVAPQNIIDEHRRYRQENRAKQR